MSIIALYSFSKITNIFYLQVFLEECNYEEKEIKMARYITEDIEISSSDDDDDDDDDSEEEESYE